MPNRNNRCGKVRHKTHGVALAHIRHLVFRKLVRASDYRPYFCAECRSWHIGRLSRERRKLEA
jgi:hypothetical protein